MSDAGAQAAKAKKDNKGGIFARIVLFFRQIVAELKLVVYPTRNQLWTYFLVVIVFVTTIMAFIGVIDFVFSALVKLIF